MNLPGFTAEASHYRSRRSYSGRAGSATREGLMLAYRPGSKTQAECQKCLDGCTSSAEICAADAWEIMLGCLFPPDCAIAAAATGEALTACYTSSLVCKAGCEVTDCCPKLCGFPNPLDPGSGCCDNGEHCVDGNQPNARDGCCPSSQSTCGGFCCPPGDTCCGDKCCPEGFNCTDGVCCGPYDHVCGGQCCPPFNKCCNGKCCKANEQCNPATGGCWSPPGDHQRYKMCRAGWEFCPNVGCCAPGTTCCEGGCYPPYQCIH